MTDQKHHSFFEKGPIRAVTLPDWMNWAIGKENAAHAVVLPMIQRGSVWAPHKLTDLWDTLLRDMPLGAFMASEETGTTVIPTGETVTRQAKANDIHLIDGQQRTLAMMVGWTGLLQAKRPVALWVDVAEKPQGEYRFRLLATTRSQPFGYEKASAGDQALSKLSRHKLRQVNYLWREMDHKDQFDAQTLWKTPGFMPWESTLALPLPEVMACRDEAMLMALVIERKLVKVVWLNTQLIDLEKLLAEEDAQKRVFLTAVRDQLKKRLKEVESATEEVVSPQVQALIAARHKVEASQFPVIQVREAHFASEAGEDKDNTDPPLAILFKRVGTAGVNLSDADYAYAVIKNLEPSVYNTVEEMLGDRQIQAVYSATSLVMSAVRMMVLKMGEANKSESANNNSAHAGLSDTAKMDRAAFARLLRKHPGFANQFKEYIQLGGAFQTDLRAVLNALAYETDNFREGLPMHALCLVKIPMLETMLAWVSLKNSASHISRESRLSMVRFALQGYLCVLHEGRASEVMVKALREDAIRVDDVFPDQALLNLLAPSNINGSPLAYTLPSPDTLKNIPGLIVAEIPNEAKPLLGWKRFDIKTPSQIPHALEHAQVYKRWWNPGNLGNHVHPMLLWLQRDYVFTHFEKQQAMAGIDDETPFDYDHLVPSAHWAYWTGRSKNELIEFQNDGKETYWYTGNCIGNLHVWESSENRSRGDIPLEIMLKLENSDFAKNGLVSVDEKWTQASPDNENHRLWTKERALAFQSAVEQRAFALYEKFYADLQIHRDMVVSANG